MWHYGDPRLPALPAHPSSLLPIPSCILLCNKPQAQSYAACRGETDEGPGNRFITSWGGGMFLHLKYLEQDLEGKGMGSRWAHPLDAVVSCPQGDDLAGGSP